MRFTVKNSGLLKRIKLANDVATKQASKEFEFTNRVTLEADEHAVTLRAFSGIVAIEAKVEYVDTNTEYECKQSGTVTVCASDLCHNLDSFPPSQMVDIEADSELVIYNADDHEEYQSQPVYPEEVRIPEASGKPSKELTMLRSVFLRGHGRVAFATGFKDRKEQYKYWRLTCEKDWCRFAACDGARIAAFDMEGKGLVDCPKRLQMVVPEEQTKILAGVLNAVSDDRIKIQQHNEGGGGDASGQMTFIGSDFFVILTRFEPDKEWPPIEKMLEMEPTCRVETDREDWEYATKGLRATWNEDVRNDGRTHESNIQVDLTKQNLILNTQQVMKSQRKVPIVTTYFSSEDSDGLKVNCSTAYIRQVFEQTESDERKIEVALVDPVQPVFAKAVRSEGTGDSGAAEQFRLVFASYGE